MTTIDGPNEGVDVLEDIRARVLAEYWSTALEDEVGQQKEARITSWHLVLARFQNLRCPSDH